MEEAQAPSSVHKSRKARIRRKKEEGLEAAKHATPGARKRAVRPHVRAPRRYTDG